MKVRIELCDRCAKQLAAWQQQFDQRTMASMAGQILQKCPECSAKLPPTEGTLFTKLPQDFEADFQPNAKPR